MQVLREGGAYLEGRERRLWCWLAVGGSGLVLVVVGAVSGYPVAISGLPVLVVLLSKVGMRLASIRKGRHGEHAVTDLLKRLPDDYYLVNDVMVTGGGGNLDHVVVGPCGVVVIETKRLAGKIRCSRDE